jgi:hypothetical protein
MAAELAVGRGAFPLLTLYALLDRTHGTVQLDHITADNEQNKTTSESGLRYR